MKTSDLMKTWYQLRDEWFEKWNITNLTPHDVTMFSHHMADCMNLKNPKYRRCICDDGVIRYEEIQEVQ